MHLPLQTVLFDIISSTQSLMKWTEKAIVTKPTGKGASRKQEGKMAVILSQKIHVSYVLPANSFLFCLHWHSWFCSAKILCEMHIPALFFLPTLKAPAKKKKCSKNVTKAGSFGPCSNEEDESLVGCPTSPATVAAVCAVPVSPWASGAQAEPCVPPTSLQSCPAAAQLQCLHHMQ